ncbi:MAG: GxxExxY protein [Candidatus Omnitrophica bacterium]|nr:GxxExxY protein [Candidatus Omnitrophota bacterium]
MQKKDALTEKIIACCFKVHSELGPGFNEKIYHNALKIALEENGLRFQIEKEFPVYFHDKKVGSLRLDLIIEEEVIIEIKALVGNMPEVFKHQVVSYLKISGLPTGLLVNFGNKSCQVKKFKV